MDMSSSAFDLLRQYIQSVCGLSLSEDKEYLIQLRLEPLAQQHNCRTFDEFVHLLKAAPSATLRRDVISAITTNETSFFRDTHPWNAITDKVLPDLLAARGKTATSDTPIRIWSAATSTGQEAFSLAMVLDEYIRAHPADSLTHDMFEIHATDISPRMVARGQDGMFNRFEINRGLSPERRDAHFVADGEQFKARDHLRQMIVFQEDNLLSSTKSTQSFDLILCRNVLIYFDNEVKRRIFQQVHNMLATHGWLILGATESTYGLTERFVSERHGPTILYRKVVRP